MQQFLFRVSVLILYIRDVLMSWIEFTMKHFDACDTCHQGLIRVFLLRIAVAGAVWIVCMY